MGAAISDLRDYVSQREPLNREGVARRINRFIDGNRQTCEWYWSEAEFSHFYAGGKQWPDEAYRKRIIERRPPLVVNKVEVAIDTFTGRMQTQRFKAQIAPENYEEPMAGPLDQFATEQSRRSHGAAETDDQFRDMWIGRVSCQQISPFQDGDVLREERKVIPPWEMMWDTDARKQNFTDRQGHVHGRNIHASVFRALFPEEEVESFFKVWNGEIGKSDEAISGWPRTVRNVWHNTNETVFLITHEWKDVEKCIHLRLPDPIDQLVVQALGGGRHTDGTVLNALTQAIVQAGPQIQEMISQPQAKMGWTLTPKDFKAIQRVWMKVADAEVPTDLYRELTRERFYRANILGDRLIGDPELIPEQAFSYLFMTDNMLKTAEAGHRPRSYIRSIQDQQDSMNRALAGWMDEAGRSIKSAFLYVTGFFKNPARDKDILTTSGASIEVAMPPVEGKTHTLVQSKPNPVFSEIFEKHQQIFAEEVISPIETGGQQDLRRVSGKVVSSVTQNARGKHASRYRAYSLALEEQVKLSIHQMHAYYSYEECLDIIGPGFTTLDPAGPDPETGVVGEVPILPPDRRLWLHALRRQVAIVESPYTETERDEVFARLNETGLWQSIAQLLPPQYALPFIVEMIPASLAAGSPKAFDILRKATQEMQQPAQPPPTDPAPSTPPN